MRAQPLDERVPDTERIMAAVSPKPVHYVPYHEVGDQPNIIADGAPLNSSVLNLSHWPVNKTPDVLKRDTSTATVFAYLDTPALHQSVEVASNNHFDEDGLFSVFALCQPELALKHRKLLLAAALAGDFGICSDRDAARLVFVIEAFADKSISPLPGSVFSGCERQQVSGLYRHMLDRLPDILEDLGAYESHWSDEETHLAKSTALIEGGTVRIEEFPELDLAVVRIPGAIPIRTVRHYLQPELAAIHPFAIHSATDCSRIIRIYGDCFDFYFRYESWLQFVSRRPLLRVKLDQLADDLNSEETAAGRWRADDIADINPRLYLEGVDRSAIPTERLISRLRDYLSNAPVAWDPYNWKPDSADS
jgi:hypothetical protein